MNNVIRKVVAGSGALLGLGLAFAAGSYSTRQPDDGQSVVNLTRISDSSVLTVTRATSSGNCHQVMVVTDKDHDIRIVAEAYINDTGGYVNDFKFAPFAGQAGNMRTILTKDGELTENGLSTLNPLKLSLAHRSLLEFTAACRAAQNPTRDNNPGRSASRPDISHAIPT